MDAAGYFVHTLEYCHSLVRAKMQRMHVHEQMAHPCNPAVLYSVFGFEDDTSYVLLFGSFTLQVIADGG